MVRRDLALPVPAATRAKAVFDVSEARPVSERQPSPCPIRRLLGSVGQCCGPLALERPAARVGGVFGPSLQCGPLSAARVWAYAGPGLWPRPCPRLGGCRMRPRPSRRPGSWALATGLDGAFLARRLGALARAVYMSAAAPGVGPDRDGRPVRGTPCPPASSEMLASSGRPWACQPVVGWDFDCRPPPPGSSPDGRSRRGTPCPPAGSGALPAQSPGRPLACQPVVGRDFDCRPPTPGSGPDGGAVLARRLVLGGC